jgi:hypothetical protein
MALGLAWSRIGGGGGGGVGFSSTGQGEQSGVFYV